MLLDSNIIIYATQPENIKLLEFLANEKIVSVSVISKIEVLGYNKLTAFDKENLELFFDNISIVSLNEEITNKAIQLKQHKKMSLGDAIIAASSIYVKIPLLTNNVDDFKHLDNLELISFIDYLNKK
jgi:predicted nucleic acid-binding protein